MCWRMFTPRPWVATTILPAAKSASIAVLNPALVTPSESGLFAKIAGAKVGPLLCET
jgi:hypothetical protein